MVKEVVPDEAPADVRRCGKEVCRTVHWFTMVIVDTGKAAGDFDTDPLAGVFVLDGVTAGGSGGGQRGEGGWLRGEFHCCLLSSVQTQV